MLTENGVLWIHPELISQRVLNVVRGVTSTPHFLQCSVGMTGLSDAVSANVGDTETCTGSALECNQTVIYVIIAPLAAFTTLAIVGALIFVLVKATAKP